MVTMVLPAPSSDIATIHCPTGDSPCEYQKELQCLRQEVDLLKEQVRTDALTGLYNFRFFSEILPLEMERASRSLQPLSLILLDIDYFKKLNDQWGHEIGNKALHHIAQLISLTIRKLDFACRFGGEEFVIVLPNTDLRQAINVAERLRERIATSPLTYEQDVISMTASLGVDEYRSNRSAVSSQFNSTNDFIERVDAWLYQAKHLGRNCVRAPDINVVEKDTSVTSDEKDALFGVFGKDE